MSTKHPYDEVTPGTRVYKCSCANRMTEHGYFTSIHKCQFHKSKSGRGGAAYYLDMGAISDRGIPCHKRLIGEAYEALGPEFIPKSPYPDSRALEIGCGIGMYIPHVLKMGYEYEAVEMDEWAAEWVNNCFDVGIHRMPFEDFIPDNWYELVIAAHVLEHVREPVVMIERIYRMLEEGGRLFLLIPDDEDPVNPDHLSFFTEPVIKSLVERAGFVKVRTAVRRRVKHENFIYVSARKPGF